MIDYLVLHKSLKRPPSWDTLYIFFKLNKVTWFYLYLSVIIFISSIHIYKFVYKKHFDQQSVKNTPLCGGAIDVEEPNIFRLA